MMKARIYEIIEKGDVDDRRSVMFDIFITTLIVVNILVVFLEYNKGYDAGNRPLAYNIIEYVSVGIFTVEYALRIYTADVRFEGLPKWRARMKYIFSGMALIDLVAILPTYLPFLLAIDLRVLRMDRLFRLLRLFKLSRYYQSMNVMMRVLKNEKEQLVMTISITLMLIFIAASLMFYIERDINPEFETLSDALWWAIATLTTVGYGDIYPTTDGGRLLSAIIAVLGIGLVALPTGILSSGFMEEINKQKKDKETDYHVELKEKYPYNYCPHCGEKLPRDK
ncbi:ion transporter [Vallitalea okinawensis]|uniref:ion transporter n=1 Tax=Vallitalea okinawensis TaxID=2078660 RepID=UPI000CFC8355|nr:ion transporter [Vallitalea okinawensis]